MKLVALNLLSIALFFAALFVALAQPLPPVLPAAAVGRTNVVKRASVTAPNGSICTTTNGQFYIMSNAVWRLK